jgi:leader peptidase (prepilin peptidase)/N-methyltransferase
LFANNWPLALLALWLLPCAIYDHRHRRVPNWLTLPPLPVALWWAWGHGALGLTLTVLAAGYIAFRLGGLGGADGKIATVVAAVSPPALALTGLLLLAGFIGQRLRGQPRALPAAPFFLAAALLTLLLPWLPSTF